MTNMHEIEAALYLATIEYIEHVGIEEFKKTSFFMSSQNSSKDLAEAA
jgi:hypothetical protein